MAADKGRSEKDRSDEEDDDEDEDEASESSTSKDKSSDPKARRHESTEGVAKALGVEDDEEQDADDEATADAEGAEDKPAPLNRAARRRAEAVRRRDARRGVLATDADEEADEDADDEPKSKKKASEDDEEEDEGKSDEEADAAEDDEAAAKPKKKAAKSKSAPLPKDKNARAKELLRRRREALEKKQDIGLSAGEVVQDQLARAAAGTGRWFTRHFRKIVAALVLGAAGATAFILYTDHMAEKSGAASDGIMKAVMAESGMVFEGETKDTRSDVEKARDPRPVFTSQAARNETIMAGYNATAAEQKDSGLAILAVMGLAGAHLQQAQWDEAITRYDEVLKSALAKADVDVRARAIEGKGLSLEGKKDYEAAIKQFTDLEGVDKSFEDLGRYQQGRMYALKGDKAKAKELFVALEKKLQVPTLDGLQQQHLRTLVNEALRAIDPSAAPKKSPFGGLDGRISPEEIERIMKQQLPGGGHDDHGGE